MKSDSELSRRAFLATTSVSAVGVSVVGAAAGCGDDDTPPPDAGPRDGGTDSGPVGPLGWRPIPALTFTVGVPVDLDLRQYLNDPSGSATVTIDNAPPDGLLFDAGALRGTPSMDTAAATYVATADDGESVATSDPFTIEVTEAGPIPLNFERATPEQIGLYLPFPNPLPDDAAAAVRYRPVGQTQWMTAHPLLRIRPEWTTGGAPETPVDAFAGTIFDLSPGTSYDVEVTVTASGVVPQTLQTSVSTRALPAPSGAATMTASPTDDLQALFDALSPGDVLELVDGTYDVDGLFLAVSGMEGAPITIRGQSAGGVVLRNDGRVLQLQEASHLVIEDLTMQGSGTDSGTDASSVAVSFWNGAVQEHVTIRRVSIVGVDKGIVAAGTVRSVLIYDCTLRGNNVWSAEYVESNLTWNDDGIRLPGEGNCVFQNTLHAFGDSLAVTDGVFSAAVYFYRNRITMTGDDACEGDYGTRNMGFYDNHVTNCSTLLSLDPLWGGPLYCFRNIAVNTIRGPFKLNNQNSGFLIYNNTIVRTEGTTGWGWVQFNNGELRNWGYRNNVLVFHGGDARPLALESGGNDPIDFTHNGWYPDGPVWWSSSGGSYGTIAEARDSLAETDPVFGVSRKRHEADVVLEREPFESGTPLGADHLTEIDSLYVPTLAAASAARGSGIEIPNITDGFTGAAPDMGAVITGRTPTSWGAPDS